MVIWIIGLSSSGKTTIGLKLYDLLKKELSNLVFLDGDILREVWGDQLTHDVKGRYKNAERISKLCKMLDNQNINIIASVLSIFPEWQDWNRKNFESYFEIFLDVPYSTLKKRDTKSLYKNAENGKIKNVVGVDIEFPKPTKSNLIITPPEVLFEPVLLTNFIFKQLPKQG